MRGLQGHHPTYWQAAALLKHFLANSHEDGRLSTSSDFAERLLRALFGNLQRLVGDIKNWEKDRPEGAPQLVLISTGTPEANREHGLESTILLDQGFRTGEAFGASGTPSAILIDADGNVASGLSVGGTDVMNLLRS